MRKSLSRSTKLWRKVDDMQIIISQSWSLLCKKCRQVVGPDLGLRVRGSLLKRVIAEGKGELARNGLPWWLRR